jgi:hypothetical protein
MMTRRAWLLADDLAGVGTAMITTRAVPALPAHHRRAARASGTLQTLA